MRTSAAMVNDLEVLRDEWDRLIETANGLMGKKKFAEAETFFKQALAMQENALGQEHPAVSATLNNYAALCVALDDFDRASELAERSLAICRKALGEGHPHVVRLTKNCQSLRSMRSGAMLRARAN